MGWNHQLINLLKLLNSSRNKNHHLHHIHLVILPILLIMHGKSWETSGILGSQPQKKRSKKSFKMWHQWNKSLSLRVALAALSHQGMYFVVNSSITGWKWAISLLEADKSIWSEKRGPFKFAKKRDEFKVFFRNLGTPSFVRFLSHTVAICSYTSCTLNWTRIGRTKRTALVARHFLRAWKKSTRIITLAGWKLCLLSIARCETLSPYPSMVTCCILRAVGFLPPKLLKSY